MPAHAVAVRSIKTAMDKWRFKKAVGFELQALSSLD